MKTALLTLVLLLAGAATALAAPGSGSSGFGGGGGGGGGGGFSGGGGTGAGSGTGSPLVILFVFGLVLVFLFVALLKARAARKRRRARVRRVELAAAEAAGDDEHFAADRVEAAAARLCTALYAAWSNADREALRAHLGPALMVEWERRLDDFDRKGWRNICEIKHGPNVEYVGLVNRADDADDRATVRVSAWITDYVRDARGNTITRNGSNSTTSNLAEYWTLGKRDGDWVLLSIEQDAEGSHHLESEIVAAPYSDPRLRDEAVNELAAADAVANPGQYADLDFDGTARAAAMDLALVDGRFAPEVLETAARRAVEAWAEAVDGDDAALERMATPEVVQELLYGQDASRRTRVVVRGPRVKALRITGLHADATPPAMTVEADINGRRYREDRDTAAVLDGSKDVAQDFTERWTMALDGEWRIAAGTLAARGS